jgi:hypothetical protein
MAMQCSTEDCQSAAVCKGKCRRCYNRRFYSPEKRREYYVKTRPATLKQRAEYRALNRAKQLAYNALVRERRQYETKAAPNTYGDRVIPIAAKGWGYLQA